MHGQHARRARPFDEQSGAANLLITILCPLRLASPRPERTQPQRTATQIAPELECLSYSISVGHGERARYCPPTKCRAPRRRSQRRSPLPLRRAGSASSSGVYIADEARNSSRVGAASSQHARRDWAPSVADGSAPPATASAGQAGPRRRPPLAALGRPGRERGSWCFAVMLPDWEAEAGSPRQRRVRPFSRSARRSDVRIQARLIEIVQVGIEGLLIKGNQLRR
jgi:hypothetical protein